MERIRGTGDLRFWKIVFNKIGNGFKRVLRFLICWLTTASCRWRGARDRIRKGTDAS